jgi:hypothetical protein
MFMLDYVSSRLSGRTRNPPRKISRVPGGGSQN